MVRKISWLLLVVMLLSALLTGCGGGNEAEKKADAKLPPITAVTAPMGSGWNNVTVLLSDIWMSKIPGVNVSVLEGGSVGNIKAVHKGLDANMGWCYTTDLRDAYLGEGNFVGQKYSDAVPIGVMYPVWLNIVSLEGSKVKTLQDMKNARTNFGAIGTGSEITAKRLLEVNGITYDSIKAAGGTVSYGNFSDAATQLKDRIVDVIVGGGGPDIPAVHEVEATKPVRLIPIDDETLKKIDALGYGYNTSLPIPANTYKGQTEPVPAISYQSLIIVNKSLPEDLVYNLVKHLWENIERIRKEQPSRGNYMRLETVFDGINTKDLHPGAAKYYKEIGILK